MLATIGHINGFILPDLYKEYTKFEGRSYESLSTEDKEKKSHIVTAIRNWAVSVTQPPSLGLWLALHLLQQNLKPKA